MQNQLEEEEKQRLREQLQEQREFRRQAQSIRWRNPVQDQNVNEVATDARSYGTEKDTLNCAFFLKTGSCRYGDACSKFHPYPPISTTLLIKNMYDGPGMSEPTDEDNDDDLEHSEEEIREHFEKFWYDIVPEFKRYGEIEQLRVCRNHSHHLRGNVYIMYRKQEEALRAFQAFHGRYYAGKKLLIQYSPVVNWKSAVCGLFTRRQCERGKQCNFLHVFSNPNGELEGRDRSSPDRSSGKGSWDRDRDRDRERDRDRDRERDRDRDRERGGERREREDERERDSHKRERGERERDRDRERGDRDDRADRERSDRDRGGGGGRVKDRRDRDSNRSGGGDYNSSSSQSSEEKKSKRLSSSSKRSGSPSRSSPEKSSSRSRSRSHSRERKRKKKPQQQQHHTSTTTTSTTTSVTTTEKRTSNSSKSDKK